MPRSSFYYKEIKRNYHEVKEAILSLYKKNKKRDGYRPMTFKLRQMGFHLNQRNFRLGKKNFIFHYCWTWLTEKLLPITLRHTRSFHW